MLYIVYDLLNDFAIGYFTDYEKANHCALKYEKAEHKRTYIIRKKIKTKFGKKYWLSSALVV